jgi:long-chain fatty acid transport protein
MKKMIFIGGSEIQRPKRSAKCYQRRTNVLEVMRVRVPVLALISIPILTSLSATPAQAGPRGSEFDLTLTPAAGGMEGVGIVRPQDPVAMLFGNPSTLTQLQGSYAFTLGASYVSPNLKARNSSTNPNPFVAPGADGKSDLTDAALPHAAVVHRVTPNLVLGGGFTGVSGLGSDYRDEPGFPNLIADLKLGGANLAIGYQVNPNLSVGGAITLGIGALQAGLLENSASVNGFGIGGTVGATYDFGSVKLGGTYKAPMEIEYDKVVQTGPGKFDTLTLEQPQEITLGIATTDLLSKDTLVELNYRYKNWDNATGYQDFWKDQHVVSLGVQHIFSSPAGAVTTRFGYSYGSELLKSASDLGNSFAGVRTLNVPGTGAVPISPALIQAAQATITNGYWRQSVSFGLGYNLTKQVRLDVNTSYAFDGEDTRVGSFDVDGSLFTAGMGLTWTFE